MILLFFRPVVAILPEIVGPGPLRTHLAAVRAVLATALPDHELIDGHWGTADQPPPGAAPPATPHMVLRLAGGPRTSDRLAPFSNRLDLRFNLTLVGATQDEVLWIADRARSALLDQLVTVAGWNTSPIRLTDSSPVRSDTDVDPPLMTAVDVYGLISTSTGG